MARRIVKWILVAALLVALGCMAAQAAPLEKTLPNGLRLVVERYQAAPVAAVRIYVHTGSVLEGKYDGAGISHLLEHVCLHGGVKYNQEQVWATARELGDDFNAYTSKEITCYYLTTTADKVERALDLLTDMVCYSAIPEDGVKQEQGTISRENSQDENEPGRVLNDLFSATLFPIHPQHIPIGGSVQALAALTHEDVVAYHRARYQPDNMVVSIVGDFDPAEMLQKAATLLNGVPKDYALPVALPAEPAPVSTRTQVQTRPDVDRTHLMLGWRSVSMYSPDMYPLDLLANILGNGDTSLLISHLKNQQGLVDDIGCGDDTPGYDAGSFIIVATCDPAKTAQVESAILSEVAAVREKGVTAAQVDKARQQIAAGKIFAEQSPSQRAESLGVNLLLTGDAEFNDHYLQKRAAVTPEQIMAVARQYLTPSTYCLAVLAPPGTATQRAPAEKPSAALQTTIFKLGNGLRVIFTPEPGSGTVYLAAVAQAGLRLEPEGQAGVSSFTAQMLMRGAGGRTREDLALGLESRGADLSAYSGRNSLGLQGQALTGEASLLAQTAATELLHPDFPPEEIERLRQETLANIALQQESPYYAISLLMRQALFPNSRYQYPETGTPETVKTLTREDLLKFYQGTVYPRGVVLALSGDLTLAAARTLAEQYFGAWAPTGPALQPAAPPSAPTQRTTRTVERQQNEGIVFYGWVGPTITGANRFVWDVLFNVLDAHSGQGRLFPTLRAAGLVYEAGASMSPGLDPGSALVYAAADPAKITLVQPQMEEAVRLLQTSPLSAADLATAKDVLVTQHALAKADPAGRTLSRALDEVYGLGYDNGDKYDQQVAQVTAEQVQNLAAQALDLNRATIIITRPPVSPPAS